MASVVYDALQARSVFFEARSFLEKNKRSHARYDGVRVFSHGYSKMAIMMCM